MRMGPGEAERMRHRMREIIDAEPLASLDYASVADPQTLDKLNEVNGPALALVAVRIGRTRLIDNMFLETT